MNFRSSHFYDSIVDQGERVILKTIEGPQLKWDSPPAAFEHQQAHEKKVTGLIDKLVDLAIKVNDHAARDFLQWFVKEQVEGEANAWNLVAKATMVCDDPGLFIPDRDLASRPPKIVLAKKE
jgi:ferritin